MELLPSDWYPFTIAQARTEEIHGFPNLVLVYRVNGGEFAYRNVLKRYPLNKRGMDALASDMNSLYFMITTDYENEYFLKQFMEPPKHGEMLVARMPDHNAVVRNIIVEIKIASGVPEKNVLFEPTEEHFYKETKGRKLPLL